MAASLNRREKLRAWRQETGRTPMKRLSYVVECASRPATSAFTPLQKSQHTTKHSVSKCNATPLSKPRRNENVPPQGGGGVRGGGGRGGGEGGGGARGRQEEGRGEGGEGGGRVSSLSLSVIKPPRQGRSNMELGEIRRQMLEEWRALNGRRLKRPPIFLKPKTQGGGHIQRKRFQKRRHTIGGGGGGGEGVWLREKLDKVNRELLKEQFLCEIAEDYAEESQQEDRHIFKSTKVRFMLSEPRNRRSCYMPHTPTLHTVYVTPVRRSTRVGRNQDTPGMKLDQQRCFDSPSEVSKQLQFEELQIVTNAALQFN